jgi:hypothetical protein
MQTRTEWFEGVDPFRVGVYERKFQTWKGNAPLLRFCYWDGDYWYLGADTPLEAALRVNLGPTLAQNLPWRGVVREIAIKDEHAADA